MTVTGRPKKTDEKPKRLYFVMLRCANHRNIDGLALENEDGTTSRRITGNKCCGRWDTVKRWPASGSEIVEALTDVSKS